MTDTINIQEPEDGAAEEGQYAEGDYGEAGSRGGIPEPLGGKAADPGRYPEPDLGDAGTVPGLTADPEIGQYADYGTDGKVGPLRKPTDHPETPTTDPDD